MGKAIEINPKHAGAYYNRGAAYRKLKQENKAIKDFKSVQGIDPTTAPQEITKDIRREVKEAEGFFVLLMSNFGPSEDIVNLR